MRTMHISLKTPLFLPFCTGCNQKWEGLIYTINSRLVSTKLKRIESQSVSTCGKTNGIT